MESQDLDLTNRETSTTQTLCRPFKHANNTQLNHRDCFAELIHLPCKLNRSWMFIAIVQLRYLRPPHEFDIFCSSFSLSTPLALSIITFACFHSTFVYLHKSLAHLCSRTLFRSALRQRYQNHAFNLNHLYRWIPNLEQISSWLQYCNAPSRCSKKPILSASVKRASTHEHGA